MRMRLPDPSDKNFATVLRMKKEITAAVFTTTARVRDQMLRPTTDDGMEAVLAEIKRKGGEDLDIFS
jgi:hypothetical protein